MSSAIAAAKRRRAFNQENNNRTMNTTTSSDSMASTTSSTTSSTSSSAPEPIREKPKTINEFIKDLDVRVTGLQEHTNGVIDEYESRFTILAEEIANIKDILIKLQSFSMEINKELHNERIRILSDVDLKIGESENADESDSQSQENAELSSPSKSSEEYEAPTFS